MQATVNQANMILKAPEAKMKDNVDHAALGIAKKLGYDYVPWYKITLVVLFIQTVLACFVLFYRPDFVTITVCTIATYMMMNTENVKKWTFRLLVFAIFLSIIYDIIWFMFEDLSSEHTEDGGVERGIRTFSLRMS